MGWTDDWMGEDALAVGGSAAGASVAGCECGSVCLCPQRFSPAVDDNRWARIVDRGRDIAARLGLRGYRAAFVHVRWTGRSRGDGVEEVIAAREILPVPVVDLAGITRALTIAQIDEAGTVTLDKVSAAYTEDQVLCRPSGGKPLPPSEALFYELRQIRGGVRRRFTPVGAAAPSYKPTAGWTIPLVLMRPARR